VAVGPGVALMVGLAVGRAGVGDWVGVAGADEQATAIRAAASRWARLRLGAKPGTAAVWHDAGRVGGAKSGSAPRGVSGPIGLSIWGRSALTARRRGVACWARDVDIFCTG
jgi:hypothetical protein